MYPVETKPIQRRYDLDWLRVLAFTGVFLYHCSRFFAASDWHIKNATTSPLVDTLKGIFDLWGMPLIFVISGASIFFALRPGSAMQFLRNRVFRLLIPLPFGILVLAPPQIYLDRLTHGKFQGNFLEFLPLYFRDWNIWGGNFAWSGVHLWYLENLFLSTLVLLPLFAVLKNQSGRRFTDALGRLSNRPGMIYLWVLPLVVLLILVDPFQVVRPMLSEDLTRLLIFPLFLVYGFLAYSGDQVRQAIIRQRRIALGLALILTLSAPIVSQFIQNDPGILLIILGMFLASMLIWCSILTILGYGMCYLTAGTPLLIYANEAVLPFYILHQPVILLAGCYVIPLNLSILAKYMIIAPLAFGITLGLYEFGIRRVNLMRRLFGLKLQLERK